MIYFEMDSTTVYYIGRYQPIQVERESAASPNHQFNPNQLQLQPQNHKTQSFTTQIGGIALNLKRNHGNQYRHFQPSNKPIPKFSELQRCLVTLKEVVPEMFGDQFIDQFYKRVYQRIYQQQRYSKNAELTSRQDISKNLANLGDILQPPARNSLSIAVSQQPSCRNQKCKSEQSSKCIKSELQNYNQFQTQPNQSYVHSKRFYIQSKPVEIMRSEQVMQTINQQDLIKIVKIVASAFCEKGYNLEAIQQQLTRKNLKRYERKIDFYKVLSHIVYKAYNFLHKYLVEQCQKQVVSLAQHCGHQFLTSFLISCTRNLQSSSCQTFYKIIKGQCSLSSQQLTPDMAVRLYQQLETQIMCLCSNYQIHGNMGYEIFQNDDGLDLQQTLKVEDTIRNIQPTANESGKVARPRQLELVNKLNKIWSVHHESQMIKAYKQGKGVAEIVAHLKSKFPKNSEAFTPIGLRSILYKLMRKAIKKFYNFIYRYGTNRLPHMNRLSTQESAAVLYNFEGYSVRVCLLDIHLLQAYDQKIVSDTIKELTKYLRYVEAVQRMPNLVQISGEQKTNTFITRSKIFPYNSRGFFRN